VAMNYSAEGLRALALRMEKAAVDSTDSLRADLPTLRKEIEKLLAGFQKALDGL
jgi:hypothetical protein